MVGRLRRLVSPVVRRLRPTEGEHEDLAEAATPRVVDEEVGGRIENDKQRTDSGDEVEQAAAAELIGPRELLGDLQHTVGRVEHEEGHDDDDHHERDVRLVGRRAPAVDELIAAPSGGAQCQHETRVKTQQQQKWK